MIAALYDHSIFHPDQIYQSLEQAHRLAFKVGFIPWEFRDGARSWFFSGLVAGMWQGLDWLGVKSSIGLVAAAQGAMVAVSLIGLYWAMRLATRIAGASHRFREIRFMRGCCGRR